MTILPILLTLMCISALGLVTLVCMRVLEVLVQVMPLIKSNSLPEVQQFNAAPKTHAEATDLIDFLKQAEQSEDDLPQPVKTIRDAHGNVWNEEDLRVL